MEKVYKATKKTKSAVTEFKDFIVKLFKVLFAMAIAGLGAYAMAKGLMEVETLRRIAFTVSGACAVLQGSSLLYKSLQDKK